MIEWKLLQRHLVLRGLLKGSEVTDVAQTGVLTPALQRAIRATQGHELADHRADRPTRPVAIGEASDLADIAESFIQSVATDFCNVVDHASGGVHVLTTGAPRGRWPKGNLKVALILAGCEFRSSPIHPSSPLIAIWSAFVTWSRLVPFFQFTKIDVAYSLGAAHPPEQEITVRFAALPPSKLGEAEYPNSPGKGQLNFSSAVVWNKSLLNFVAIHEIGHLLGLSHSNDKSSIMFPNASSTARTPDADSVRVLNSLYAWEPVTHHEDRASTDRPTLGKIGGTPNFSGRPETPVMAWTGTIGDSGIYFAQLGAEGWSSQARIPGVGSSASPALTEVSDPAAGNLATGVFMAWKGAKNDTGLYWTRRLNGRWEAQRHIPGVGTSAAPALCGFDGKIAMAWKGVPGDDRLWWSTWTDAGGWTPQRPIDGWSSDGPALATLGNRLFLFWKGIPGDTRIWFTSIGPGEANWRAQGTVFYQDFEDDPLDDDFIAGPQKLPETDVGVSATTNYDRIVLAWKDTKWPGFILYSYFDGNQFWLS